MKNTLSILLVLLFANFTDAQINNYENLWDKVEQLERKGLPKSALKIVEDISNKASKNNNKVQLIKTMFFKGKFALVLEEDAQLNIINDFKTQIIANEFPVKNVLESILANLYWQYFNQNRWQFYNRTKTAIKVDKADFRTWDLQTLFNEIHVHFQKSLQNGLMLQQENLENYSVLLNEQSDSKLYRPTLFDFLNHEALSFYKTSETQIAKPANKFEIDNSDFLSNSEKFSTIKIESKDSVSLQLNTLKIYQDLIQFHLKDKSPYALTEVNIERLKFVNQHATFDVNDAIFLEVLKTESNRLNNHEVSALYDYEIAFNYYKESLQYQPKTKEKNRWKASESIAICDKVISKFPKSKGAKKCAVLKSQIEEQTLQITIEDFLPIQQNARLLVRYKNLEALQFRGFQLSEKDFEKLSNTYRKDEQLNFINKLKVDKNWNIDLRIEQDYQTHTTEALIPKLNNGRYLIVASIKNDDETFAFATLQVTNLALVETETFEYKIFQIINRNNGAPISNANVELTYASRNNKNLITKNYTTSSLGEIKIEKDNSWYRNVNLKVEKDDEIAYFGDFYLNQVYKNIPIKEQYKGFVFSDRSIYRPGQTVYFKAIALKIHNGKSDVLEKTNVFATLYNANSEEVKKLELTTNEFGSVAGEFILPNNGLNGQYYIELDADKEDLSVEHYFSVEEYKRPKFETSFKPVIQTYKVNDSVTIKGNALAYAGSNISDAKVVYRVHRKVQYPRWYFWYRPWFISEPQEIARGETITNSKGEFEITFKAIPDQSVDKSSLPIFNYEIIADVTDLNGETRNATTIVNVGYHALVANMTIDNLLDKTKKDHKISIDTKNLNGEFVPAMGSIKIYKLKAPKLVLRSRPWSAPDYQELTYEAFKKLFPFDAYLNEHDSNNWEKGKLVFEKSFDTEKSKYINLGKIKKWQSGQYLLTLESKDKFGQVVIDELKTTVYSDIDNTLADNQLFSITSNKSTYKPGETAILTLASAAENLNVTVTIEKNKKVIKTQIVQLNNNKKTISIPVTNSDYGGFAIHYSFAFFNSFNASTEIISVPYPETDLEIETKTFRDKVKPGTDETWSFTIKGALGEKVSAELLASMYDVSLDQFKSHTWNFNPVENQTYNSISVSRGNQSFGTQNFRVYKTRYSPKYREQYYDKLNWFGFYFGSNRNMLMRRTSSLNKMLNSQEVGVQLIENEMDIEESIAPLKVSDASLDEIEVIGYGEQKNSSDTNENNDVNFDNIKIRKNFKETAFFFPQLQTDKDGNISFSFTTPEALTQWKLQLLAHTKTLESAVKTLRSVTQKDLMVIPNTPRFLREGDNITISTKIANLTEKKLTGHATLVLTDAILGNDVNEKLKNLNKNKTFSVDAQGNTEVSWNLSIPDDVQAVQYKVIAKAGDFSDGEQNALPVLSNRMLVTETLPMWIRSNETRTFTLDKLKTNSLTTRKNHKLTLEITSNPAWYAIQALPYLMEYPFDCNEQTFSRYYANALASHIAHSNPRIQEVFNQWKNSDVLLSNLEKNEELKSILIQETPWLRDALSETEQKKRIALLFDLNKMTNELQRAINKLKANQMGSGAWAWFNGGRENRYITQHIITGFGHLKKLKVNTKSNSQMVENAIRYLDNEFVKEYKDIRKYDDKIDLGKDHLSYMQLHYLYMRSFYPEFKKSKEVENIIGYYQTQIQKYWLTRSLFSKGLMALISNRNEDLKTASKILKSLKETSITSEELGMYWKSNTNSWHWYQAPIETHALLIEAFSEIENDTKTIDNLKIWLLKNKQTNRWKTTKATTEAIYALLLQGSDWISVTDMIDVVIGGKKLEPTKLENVKVEAGTGYYKTSWNSSDINPEMGEVSLTKKENGIAWGSLYWQYFEDLDKITSAKTPLKLSKKLFIKNNTDLGEEISQITESTILKVGDLVRVRIELRCDRALEFVHMKDMRAAGLEPVNVLSQYKWQDGLGYYESTKDASTNFFFDYLPKGIFVFEYDLRVNNSGNMSNGITTIQSMYAPEFSSHSEGVRLLVK
ncbi:MAG: alpha-2-macroglobulin [Flaviramulus sp.]|nr:MG2 domain-containing protein [Flaviramulus sp.]NNC51328.1 alpha-2-macroglobulin [Flaviramulus sp.]